MKTIKGYQYAVTATEEVTITDANGLNLTCPAGQQTYFVATGDEVEVTGECTVTQTRGGIIAGGGGGGGGGEKIAPGEVVVGGTQGSAFVAMLNECKRCPMFITGDLPEGVTFEQLEEVMIEGAQEGFYGSYSPTNVTTYIFPTSGAHPYGSIFAKSPLTTLPSTVKFTNLKVGKYGFQLCSSLQTFDTELPALTNGYAMFESCTSLTRWDIDFPSLNGGGYMFDGCSSLQSFDAELPAMTNGYGMFYNCTALTSVNAKMPLVQTFNYMFYNCSALTTLDLDLPKVNFTDTGSLYTFQGCSRLRSFRGNLSSLTKGAYLFYWPPLTSFEGSLDALTSGEYMFSRYGGYGPQLTSFISALPSLSYGNNMFNDCKLDIESVNRIANSVPSYTSGSHPITIGVDSTQVTQDDQNAANAIMVGKGWTVTWQRN